MLNCTYERRMCRMNSRLTIALVDDDPDFAQKAVCLLNRLGYFHISAFSSLSAFAKENPEADLLISDICLNSQTRAFEELELLDPALPVIYCSSFSKYSRAAYSPQAIAYVLKPHLEEELPAALQKAEQFLGRQEKVTLKTWHDTAEIPVRSLESIIRHENRLSARLAGQKEPLELSERSLKDCMQKLPPDIFVQASQSVIINLYRIRTVDSVKRTVRMHSQEEIPVSRRKWNEVISGYLARGTYAAR